MNRELFSDEFLNAFVDDQLTPEEKSRAYEVISQDETLNRRVCELRRMRDMIQVAYRNPPLAPDGRASQASYYGTRHGIAAGVILACGILLGWLLHQQPEATPPSADAAGKDSPIDAPRGGPAGGGMLIAAQAVSDAGQASGEGREMKVLLHLNSGRPARMKEVLDEAENLLRLYEQTHQIARVQIIANGEGLNLLRADTSPFAPRVSKMLKKYDNLTFAACQNTIDRLKRERGITAQLLPGATVIDSGVAQIILRQQQGWIYIQV